MQGRRSRVVDILSTSGRTDEGGGQSRRGDPKPPGAGKRLVHFLWETAIILVIAIVLAALLRGFVVQAFVVPTGSMLPTIQEGDRIAVTKLGDVDRGDVVVFEDPGGWLTAAERPAEQTGVLPRFLEFVGVLPATDKGYLVKRLIAEPGDRVKCCDRNGRVTVNGSPLLEEDYLPPRVEPSDEEFDVVVPKDAVWVMGDNRPNSRDSRRNETAFVPLDNLVGEALATVWPVRDWKGLGRPDTFRDVPDRDRPAPDEPIVRTPSSAGASRG
ncbi:MAG: signal peptidase I [Propionibacteriales bacterium]|nr:signal peptidase I [Propionibacteriales bacterium]